MPCSLRTGTRNRNRGISTTPNLVQTIADLPAPPVKRTWPRGRREERRKMAGEEQGRGREEGRRVVFSNWKILRECLFQRLILSARSESSHCTAPGRVSLLDNCGGDFAAACPCRPLRMRVAKLWVLEPHCELAPGGTRKH